MLDRRVIDGSPSTTSRRKTRRVNVEKGSVESTHKVPTSHYHTKHCHAAVVSLGGLTHRCVSRLPPVSFYR